MQYSHIPPDKRLYSYFFLHILEFLYYPTDLCHSSYFYSYFLVTL